MMDVISKQLAELEKLKFMIGKWRTDGIVRATATTPEIRITGTDTYEFVGNGFFILHTVDVRMGEEKIDNVEIIYFDKSSQNFAMRAFDSAGNFTTMHSELTAGKLLLTANNMRSSLTFDPKGSEMFAIWERSDDGIHWLPWMDIKFRK